MKRLNKIKTLLVAGLMVGITGAVVFQQAFAATGSIYMSPSSTTVEINKTVKFDVRINPGTAVDGVEVALSYDQAKLQFVSIDSGSSAFPVQLAQSGGSGSVQITRGKLGGSVSSNSRVAYVTFKAKVSSGSSSVSLSGNATASGSGNYTYPSTTGATVNFKAAPVAPKPDPKPTPTDSGDDDDTSTSDSGSGSSGGDSGTSTDTGSDEPSQQDDSSDESAASGDSGSVTTPAGTKVSSQVKQMRIKAVQLAVKANKAVRVYVKYGIGDQLSFKTATTKSGKNHSVNLDKNNLIPGTKYSYQVVVVGAGGKETVGKVQTFLSKGYTVKVTVLDKDNRPIANRTVTLFSDPIEGKTDGDGVVQFSDVSPGEHSIVYTAEGNEYSEKIFVEDSIELISGNKQVPVQTFSVVYARVTFRPELIIAAAVLVCLAVIVTALVLLYKKGKLQKLQSVVQKFGKRGGGKSADSSSVGSSKADKQSETDRLLSSVKDPEMEEPGSVVKPKDESDNKG